MKETALFLAFLAGITILNAQNKSNPAVSPSVEVYYFHPTERCPIDQAIEDNTKQTIKTDFQKEIKSGVLKLQVLNTDDKANAKVVSRFDINAQALYIVKHAGGKELKTDLTVFAFDVAAVNPQKFRVRLKDEIEAALK